MGSSKYYILRNRDTKMSWIQQLPEDTNHGELWFIPVVGYLAGLEEPKLLADGTPTRVDVVIECLSHGYDTLKEAEALLVKGPSHYVVRTDMSDELYVISSYEEFDMADFNSFNSDTIEIISSPQRTREAAERLMETLEDLNYTLR